MKNKYCKFDNGMEFSMIMISYKKKKRKIII